MNFDPIDLLLPPVWEHKIRQQMAVYILSCWGNFGSRIRDEELPSICSLRLADISHFDQQTFQVAPRIALAVYKGPTLNQLETCPSFCPSDVPGSFSWSGSVITQFLHQQNAYIQLLTTSLMN